MKPEVKKLWIDALRSGEYIQTKETLRSYDDSDNENPKCSYCCLGVLCDLYHKVTGKGEWNVQMFDNSLGIIPLSVSSWAGLEDKSLNNTENYQTLLSTKLSSKRNPVLIDKKTNHLNTLSSFNDHENYDFNQIADLIEDNL